MVESLILRRLSVGGTHYGLYVPPASCRLLPPCGLRPTGVSVTKSRAINSISLLGHPSLTPCAAPENITCVFSQPCELLSPQPPCFDILVNCRGVWGCASLTYRRRIT